MKNGLSRHAVLPTIMLAMLVAGAIPSRANADQSHMQAALDALKRAQRELTQATADKGGHRAEAMALVNQAIAQVEKGITFDRKN